MKKLLTLLISVIAITSAEFRCDDQDDGLYVTGCSSQYDRCHSHQHYHLQCPSGMKFNPDLAKCDFEFNIGLCINRPSSAHLTVKAHEPFDCTWRSDGTYSTGKCSSSYFHCFHGNVAMLPCPSGLYYNDAAKACDYHENVQECRLGGTQQIYDRPEPQGNVYHHHPGVDCSSKPDGLYSLGYCSRNYFQCSNGYAYLKTCTGGLIFNPALRQCDYAQNCQNPPQHEPPPASPPLPSFSCEFKSDGVYLDQPGTCQDHFWKCSNSFAFLYRCPGGTAYDEQSGKCDFQTRVHACGGGAQPTEPPPPPPPQQSFDCSYRPDGFYQLGSCVQSFAQCANGITYTQNCPDGLVLGPQNVCVYPDQCNPSAASPPVNHFVPPPPPPPDHLECSYKEDGYYEIDHCGVSFALCSSGSKYVLRCPSGLVFNPIAGACDIHHNCLNPESGTERTEYFRKIEPQKYNNNGDSSSKGLRVIDGQNESENELILPNCEEIADGPHALERCSSNYFLCFSKQTYLARCPSKLIFNPYNNQCDYPLNNPGCNQSAEIILQQPEGTVNPVQSAPENDKFCETRADGLYSAGCETYFYACRSRKAYRLYCPIGFYFNVLKSKCDSMENVPECNRRTEGKLKVPKISPPNYNCTGKRDGYYSLGCSTKYYACTGGYVNRLECPPQLVYDKESQACNYKQNVQSCILQTQQSTQSSPTQQPSKQANPSQIITASMDNGFCSTRADGVYGNGCSAQYFVCSQQKTFTYFCPQGKVFNELVGSCDDKEHVHQCRLIASKTQA